MRSSLFAGAVVVGLAACGGEAQTAPPAGGPPAPTTTATTPTTAATAETAATTSTEASPPPKPSLAELQKKALTEQWAALNAHDLKGAMAAFAADAVFVSPEPGGFHEQSVDEFRAMHEKLFAAFPDLKFGAKRAFVKGNVVVYEWVVTGTNTGEFMGEKATGKKIGVMAASIDWFTDDGRIKKETNYIDGATIAQQLGKMPGKYRPLADLPAGEPQWNWAKNDDAETKTLDTLKTKMWPAVWPKDGKAYEATLTDDSAHYEIAGPNDFVGKKACMAEQAMYAKALPDAAAVVDEAWVVGNVAIVQFTFRGTMKGAIGPFKPTGKPLTIHGLDFDEVNGDKMGKAWTYSNGMELLHDLGVLPKPKAAPGEAAKKPTK